MFWPRIGSSGPNTHHHPFACGASSFSSGSYSGGKLGLGLRRRRRFRSHRVRGVVELYHGLGQIQLRRDVVNRESLRRGVHHQLEPVPLSIIVKELHHLLPDSLANVRLFLLSLGLEVFLCPLEDSLFVIQLARESSLFVVAQRRRLPLQLVLQGGDFLLLVFEVRPAGREFLLQVAQSFLALTGVGDCGLHVDHGDLAARGRSGTLCAQARGPRQKAQQSGKSQKLILHSYSFWDNFLRHSILTQTAAIFKTYATR